MKYFLLERIGPFNKKTTVEICLIKYICYLLSGPPPSSVSFTIENGTGKM